MADQQLRMQIVVDEVGASAANEKVQALGTSADETAAKFTTMGTAAEASGAKVAAGMEQSKTSILSARENIRLLNDDIGLRLPRAMQAAIRESAALSGAISAAGTGLIALGAIDIFSSMAERAGKLYDEYVSISSVQDQFFAEMEKRKDADFVNSRSIETTRDRINEATGAMTQFNAVAEQAQHSGLTDLLSGNFIAGIGGILGGRKLAGEGAKAGTQAVEMGPKQIEQQLEVKQAQIDADHALDSSRGKQAAITGEMSKQLSVLEAQRTERRQLDQAMGNKSSGTDSFIDQKEAAARGEARAKEIELSRTERDEVIKARTEAANAGIQGEQLYMRQAEEAIDAIARREQDGAISRVASIALVRAENEKYFNDLAKRQDEMAQKTAQLQRESDEASMGPMQRIQAQTSDKMSETLSAFNYADVASGAQSFDDFQDQGAAIMSSGDQKMLEEKRRFTEELKDLTDRANDAQLQGYARVAAEENRMMDSLNKRFSEEFHGQDFSKDPDYQKASGAIGANSGREMAQEQQQQLRETQTMEAEAARYTASTWSGAIAEINSQYDLRLAKEQEFYNTQAAYAQSNAALLEQLWKQHNDRLTALDDIRAGQVERQAEQERDAMAGAFSSLLKNPMQFFEQRGEKMATELLANNVMKLGGGPQGKGTSAINEVLGVGGKNMSTHFGVAGDKDFDKFSASGGRAASQISTLGDSAQRAAAALSQIGGASAPSRAGTPAGTAAIASGAVPGAPGAGVGTSLYGTGSVSSGATPSAGVGGGSTGVGAYGGGGNSSAIGAGGGAAASARPSGIVGETVSDAQQGYTLARNLQAAHAAANAANTASTAANTAGTASSTASQAAGDSSSFAGGIPSSDPSKVAGAGIEDGSEASATSGVTSGAVMGAAGGAIAGGTEVASGYQSHSFISGGAKGALGGAEAGAAIGALAGPGGMLVGAAIGAVVGGIIGIAGGFHSPEAEKYDKQTVRPALGETVFDFDQSGDYMTGKEKIDGIQKQAMDATNKMGGAGQRYYQSHIKKEIQQTQALLSRQEKAGRSNYTASAAEYDTGGPIYDFGDLATSPDHGFIHAQMGEHVIKPRPAYENAGMLHAMNSGKSLSDIMAPFLRGQGSTTSPQSGGGGNVAHFHFHTPDSDTAHKMILRHADSIRMALNESFSNNGQEAV